MTYPVTFACYHEVLLRRPRPGVSRKESEEILLVTLSVVTLMCQYTEVRIFQNRHERPLCAV